MKVGRFWPAPHIHHHAAFKHEPAGRCCVRCTFGASQPRQHAQRKRKKKTRVPTRRLAAPQQLAHRKLSESPYLPAYISRTRGTSGLPPSPMDFNAPIPQHNHTPRVGDVASSAIGDRPYALNHLMEARQDMSSGEPFQLLPGLHQQAPIWHRNRHFPVVILHVQIER